MTSSIISSSPSVSTEYVMEELLKTTTILPGIQQTVWIIEGIFWIGRRLAYWQDLQNHNALLFGTLAFRTISDQVQYIKVIAKIIHIVRILSELATSSEELKNHSHQFFLTRSVTIISWTYVFEHSQTNELQYIQGESPNYIYTLTPINYICYKISVIFTWTITFFYLSYAIIRCILELKEALQTSSMVEEEEANRIFIDIEKTTIHFNHLAGGMIQYMETNSEMMNRLLKALHSPIGANQICSTLQTISKGTSIQSITGFPQYVYRLFYKS